MPVGRQVNVVQLSASRIVESVPRLASGGSRGLSTVRGERHRIRPMSGLGHPRCRRPFRFPCRHQAPARQQGPGQPQGSLQTLRRGIASHGNRAEISVPQAFAGGCRAACWEHRVRLEAPKPDSDQNVYSGNPFIIRKSPCKYREHPSPFRVILVDLWIGRLRLAPLGARCVPIPAHRPRQDMSAGRLLAPPGATTGRPSRSASMRSKGS